MKQVKHLFVYGTLRPGHAAHNNFNLDKDAIHLGTQEISGTMFTLGAYPGVFFGGSGKIVGDLYEIDESKLDEILDVLDSYEGYSGLPGAHNLYNRVEIDVNGTTAYSYEYAGSRRGRPVIHHGDWINRDRAA